MTATYTCPRGCCSVQLGAATPRGTDRDVYLNGERGTYATFAKRLGGAFSVRKVGRRGW